jgi:hypothetical protein
LKWHVDARVRGHDILESLPKVAVGGRSPRAIRQLPDSGKHSPNEVGSVSLR